jgi:predicted transcriptional regulator
MAKDIICALVMFDKNYNVRHVAKALGVDRRNIKRTYEKQRSLDTIQDAFWINNKPKKRVDGLCEIAIQQIQSFWTLETIDSPNVKDVIHKRIGVKEYVVNATHYLQDDLLQNISNAFLVFLHFT